MWAVQGLHAAFSVLGAEFVHGGGVCHQRSKHTLPHVDHVPSAVLASGGYEDLWVRDGVVPSGVPGKEDRPLFSQHSGSQDHNVARADAVCLRNY